MDIFRHIELGPPSVVAVSPPKYGDDPDGKWWGFFQFPDLWRGNDGALYLAVNVGADSTVGEHEPTLFFSSKDGGRIWQTASLEDMDLTPQPIRLPDGSEVAFGETRYLYHVQAITPAKKTYSAKKLGLKPLSGPVLSPYKVTESVYYNYNTVPESLRRFPVAWRRSSDAPWQKHFGTIDMPDLVLTASARDGWWDANGKFEWTEKGHEFTLPVPQDPATMLALPDGTLLWALASQNPKVMDRRCGQVACLASRDRGQTWRVRGFVANDTALATWGYVGEQSLARMPDGDLLCVVRTKCSNEAGDTHYLAAARSADNGFTWSTPAAIAEFSVTPHLLCLENGAVALVYGRPGVHVKTSTDSGRTWSESVPLVGPSEKDLLAMPLAEWWRIRHDFSCANTSVVAAVPDRFLVAYSDFRHFDAAGLPCKAIKVQAVVVTRNEAQGGRLRQFDNQ